MRDCVINLGATRTLRLETEARPVRKRDFVCPAQATFPSRFVPGDVGVDDWHGE